MAQQLWFRRCADLIEDNRELETFVDVRQLVAVLRSSDPIDQRYWLPVCLGLWMKQFMQNSSRWNVPTACREHETIVSANSGNGVAK